MNARCYLLVSLVLFLQPTHLFKMIRTRTKEFPPPGPFQIMPHRVSEVRIQSEKKKKWLHVPTQSQL
jgi:hypothetical protein